MTWAGFRKKAYQSARDWGMQPSEFWQSSIQEWWWELEARVEQAKRMTIGMGGVSEWEWEQARKRHQAKKKAKNDNPVPA